QAHVRRMHLGVHAISNTDDVRPLLIGVRLRHAGSIDHTFDVHRKAELRLDLLDPALNWPCCCWLRCTRKRNVPLSRKQPRGGIQTDPSSARHVTLAPGMQISKIGGWSRGAVHWFLIWGELNQIPGNESRCEPHVSQYIHQQ